MHESGWESALQWAIWLVIMALVMSWLGRRRLRPRPESEAGNLAHPPSTLAIGMVTTTLFGALAIVSVAYPAMTADRLTTAIFACLALLGLPLIADYYHARHSVSESGLEYGSLTGNRGSMRWDEVKSLRYGTVMKWFRIEDVHGNVARLSIMLTGLPEFAHLALQHVPAEALDHLTREILEQTASGRPPSIW